MRARFCALLWMVLLAFTAVALILFATIHWQNFWSLFIALPCAVAFFVPALCFNYQPLDEVDTTHVRYDAETFQNCREFGWVLAVAFILSAYGIPILAWYNDAFACGGAVVIQIALTCLVWAYLLWLRVFGPFKNM